MAKTSKNMLPLASIATPPKTENQVNAKPSLDICPRPCLELFAAPRIR